MANQSKLPKQPDTDGLQEAIENIVVIESKMKQKCYLRSYPRAVDGLLQLFAAHTQQLLQSKREELLAALPVKKTMVAAKSSGSDAGWGYIYGFNEALDTCIAAINKVMEG